MINRTQIYEFYKMLNRGNFYIKATDLKFGNLLGMEIGNKYKISALYL